MRTEFTGKTKNAAVKRSGGACECHLLGKAGIPGFTVEGCGRPIGPGNVYFEHINPDGNGGDNSLDNCAAVTKTCGAKKARTYDAPKVAKTKAKGRAAWGTKSRKGPPMPGSKASGWKRPMNGPAVRR